MSSVLFEKRGQVAWVTLNRPAAKNTMNAEVFVLLAEAWREVREDKSIRVAGDDFTKDIEDAEPYVSDAKPVAVPNFS